MNPSSIFAEEPRVVETAAGQLEVHVLGSAHAPPVLFVHGALVSASVWAPVVERLRSTHRCIVPEMPLGSHRVPLNPDAEPSPKNVAGLLAEVLDALGVARATVVGNDTGGAISQVFAAHHPDRVAHLVLTNSDALEVFPPAAYRYLKRVARRPLQAALMLRALHAMPLLGLRDTAWGGLARDLTTAQIRAWVAPAATSKRIRHDALSFLRAADASDTVDAAFTLSRSNVPATLVWGTADPFFSLDLARRLSRVLGDAPIRRVEGARCYVMLDEPAAVAEAIRDAVGARARGPLAAAC